MNKLKSLEQKGNQTSKKTKDERKNDKDDDENKSNKDDAGSSDDKKEGNKKDGESQSESNKPNENKSGASGGGDDKENADIDKTASKKDNKRLTSNASRQVEQYMKQLEQKNKSLQGYFSRNGQAKQQNGDSPFSDPFFQQFFAGTPFEQQFSKRQQNLDKDW